MTWGSWERRWQSENQPRGRRIQRSNKVTNLSLNKASACYIDVIPLSEDKNELKMDGLTAELLNTKLLEA